MKVQNSPLRIAEIPYLNCAPFYWNKDFLGGIPVHWVSAPPKKLGDLARIGSIDAGPISLVDSFQIEKDFEPLDFGIAVKYFAQSVLLFSKRPFTSLNGSKIGTTPESVTSVQLLRLILEKKYGTPVTYRKGFRDTDDAQLRIGDDALVSLKDHSLNNPFPEIIDLGQEWVEWKSLPFVFARWMIRRDIGTEKKRRLLEWLERNLKEYERNNRKALNRYLPGKKFTPRSAQIYLNGFNYCFRSKEKKSISLFKKLLNS